METRDIKEERDSISKALSERLEAHDESRKAAQEKIHETYEGLRAQIKDIEGKNNSELEDKFKAEDSRLQTALNELRSEESDELPKTLQKAKAELLVMQSYEVIDRNSYEEEPPKKKEKKGKKAKKGKPEKEVIEKGALDLASLCVLKTETHAAAEVVELLRPANVHVTKSNKGALTLQFTCLSPEDMRVLSEHGLEDQIAYKCLVTKRGESKGNEYALKSAGGDCFRFTPKRLAKSSMYEIRVKVTIEGKGGEWSDEIIISDGAEMEVPESGVRERGPEKLNLEGREDIKRMLSECLEAHDESRKAAQERIHEICEGLRGRIDELEEEVSGELEDKFKAEDSRLQTALNELRSDDNDDDISKAIQKAKAALLVMQSYEVIEKNFDENEDDGQKDRIPSLCELKTERKISLLKVIDFEERKPMSLIPSFTEKGELSLSFTFFDEDEVEVLNKVDSPLEVEVKVWENGHEEDTSRTLTKELILGEPICLRSTFTASTAYCLKMKIAHQGLSTQWSDEAEFTPEFKECCVWKECPDNVRRIRKYSVDEENHRIATMIGADYCDGTIIGNTPLPLNTVTSWNIKILKSKDNNGSGIFIGVAPSDIDQNEINNYCKCGWYFNCYWSGLLSGPPHNHSDKAYGPRKEDGKYIHTGDSVGVVVDTAKGELSFVVDGVNLGVAYEGIPLDKPLVPCVLLKKKGDSVELVI